MASVTITDLLMLVAVLFILYFILYTITTKKTKEEYADIGDLQLLSRNTLASTRLGKKDKSCSQESINSNYLHHVFDGKNKNQYLYHPYECKSTCFIETVDGVRIGKIKNGKTIIKS